MVETPKEHPLESPKVGIGYCIGCRGKVVYDPRRPLCNICYKKWEVNTGKFRIYPQKYCHTCGEGWRTTINNPICSSCQQKSRTLARQNSNLKRRGILPP